MSGFKIPVGTPVHYYAQGRSHGAEPAAAIVMESHPNGLCVLDVRGMTIKSVTKHNVWHISSPELETHEHFRDLYGAWDFHPWFKPPRQWLEENMKKQEPQAPESPAPEEPPKDPPKAEAGDSKPDNKAKK